VVRRCVWSRTLDNEEALAHWGLSRQKQTNQVTKIPYSLLVKDKSFPRKHTFCSCAWKTSLWCP